MGFEVYTLQLDCHNDEGAYSSSVIRLLTQMRSHATKAMYLYSGFTLNLAATLLLTLPGIRLRS